jgi:phosphomannomutase/phosphoglucomutase
MRLFGTNGIREVVGQKLTPPFAVAVAGAIARCCTAGPPVAVGWDGRTSSPGLAALVTGTLALAGHNVVQVGMMATPAIQYNVKQLGAQMGVIVTASHNPPEYNGIKCIATDGLEVPRTVEEEIERAVQAQQGQAMPYDRIGRISIDSLGPRRYVDGILQQVDAGKIAQRKLKVLLDCGNGASVVTSPELLRRLGCHLVTLNAQLDGMFPGHMSEPTETNLVDLVKGVPAVGADLGIAHDGDADRAVFVDRYGKYLPGEKILTLLARDFVRRNKGGVVVTPVSASQSVEDVVRQEGGELVYTRVGSPVVTREMLQRKAIFGGEENGGLIFPKFQLARDGAMTAAAVLDFLAREEVGLDEALRDLPQYSLTKEKVQCPVELRDRVFRDIAEKMSKEAEKIVMIDGVKAYRDGGWVLLRPSGTEPLIRVFAEAPSPALADKLAREAIAEVERSIQRAAGRP